MSKYHAVSSGMVTRQALPSITRQRGTTTGSANLMLYGAGKTTVSNNTTFIDSSANAFTVTRNGDTVQSGFNPFSQASAGAGYFDGTGDYLTVPANAAFNFGSGDWTVECWVNLPLTSTMRLMGQTDAASISTTTSVLIDVSTSGVITAYIGASGGSSFISATGPSSISANTWAHIVATRNGNNFYVYVNGVAGTATSVAGITMFSSAEPWTVGRNGTYNGFYVTGYISNVRVVKGTAVYTSNFTPPTSPLTAISGTSLLLLMNNYSIVNSTSTNLPVTINGNTTISTAQYPTGMSSSIYFDGTGDYLLTANNAIFTFGTGDFTIEFYARYESYGSGGGNFVSNTSDNLNIYYSNTGKLGYWNGTAGTESSGSVPLSTWFHCAAVRSGTTFKLYYNGTSVITTTDSRNITTNNMVFGRNGTAGSLDLNGYLSNVRVCKGTALYTANFTPPALPMSTTVTVPAYVTNNIYGMNQIP